MSHHDEPLSVLDGESCLLTLNYAWYHVAWCVLQALVLWWGGRTKHFRVGHAFGLFALAMDFGLAHLSFRTRTVSYPGHSGFMDEGQEVLGPVGSFLFFVWFDYSAFGIYVWAAQVEELLQNMWEGGVGRAVSALAASPVDIFGLLCLPVQFWTAPVLSGRLGLDPRELLLRRASPKLSYAIALPIFVALLKRWGGRGGGAKGGAGLSWPAVVMVLLSGLGCGLCHHAALFAFKKRGYSSASGLALTLATEWPALIAGLKVCTELGPALVDRLPGQPRLGGGGGLEEDGNTDNEAADVGGIGSSGKEDDGGSRSGGLRQRQRSAKVLLVRARSASPPPHRPTTTAGQAARLPRRIRSPSFSSPPPPPSRPRFRGADLCSWAMVAVLSGCVAPKLAHMSEEDFLAYLIPAVPGEHMQSVGTAYLRSRTCLAPRLLPAALRERTLDCWGREGSGADDVDDGSSFFVMASAAKAGAVLTAKVAAEVGAACGLCVASGERSRAGIPGPVEDLPSYDGTLLFAIINMRTWPHYARRLGYGTDAWAAAADPLPPGSVNGGGGRSVGAGSGGAWSGGAGSGGASSSGASSGGASSGGASSGAGSGGGGRVRCVTTLRDPVARLRSLYLYARSGGEAWFRSTSGLMQRLQVAPGGVEGSVALFWETFGRDYLVQSHAYMALNLALGCKPVRMEGFAKDFDGTLDRALRAWGIVPGARRELVARLGRTADVGRMSEAQRASDPHLSATKFSPAFLTNVSSALLRLPGLRELAAAQRKELGYPAK